MVQVKLEFSGGLEMLFGGHKSVEVDVPSTSGSQVTVENVIAHARDNLLTERPELFMKGNTVRPGILVLINDCDWELSETLKTQLAAGDRLTFISTLHGG